MRKTIQTRLSSSGTFRRGRAGVIAGGALFVIMALVTGFLVSSPVTVSPVHALPSGSRSIGLGDYNAGWFDNSVGPVNPFIAVYSGTTVSMFLVNGNGGKHQFRINTTPTITSPVLPSGTNPIIFTFTADPVGVYSYCDVFNATSCGTFQVKILGDVNGDGVVNIQDASTAAFYSGSSLSPTWNLGDVPYPHGVVDYTDLYVVSYFFGTTGPWPAPYHPDIDGDGIVNVNDLAIVSSRLGQSAPAPFSDPNQGPDIDYDNTVNSIDTGIIASNFGSQACVVGVTDLSTRKGGVITVNGVNVNQANIGQEMTLTANVNIPVTGLTFSWQVAGDVIDNYHEVETNPPTPTAPYGFSVVPHPTNVVVNGQTVAAFSGQTISFFWREAGVPLPVARSVTVVVSNASNSQLCQGTTTFGVERNNSDPSRTPEAFYTSNHSTEVLVDHDTWHVNNPCCPAWYNGAEFFMFHLRLIGRYEAWRQTFGYPDPIGVYDPSTPIPATENGFTLCDTTRTVSPGHACDGTADPSQATPTYFTTAGGSAVHPASACDVGGETKLSDFATLMALGCAITSPFHNTVHGVIGGFAGDMGCICTAPIDPIFWRWHNYLTTIANSWASVTGHVPLLTQPNALSSLQSSNLPPQLNWILPPARPTPCCLPPPGPYLNVASFSQITVSFSQNVTGLSAANLAVLGSNATSVVGTGNGPYVFTGFTSPGFGNATIHLYPGNIVNSQGQRYGGAVWAYTVNSCSPSLDGNGIVEGQCWPLHSDDCPGVYYPDQWDSSLMPYNSTMMMPMVGDACKQPSIKHQVSVTQISSNGESVPAGSTVQLRITVANQGTLSETFNVGTGIGGIVGNSSSTGYNVTNIQRVTLAAGASKQLLIDWIANNPGIYTIEAGTDVVPGQNNATSSVMISRFTITVLATGSVGGATLPTVELMMIAPLLGLGLAATFFSSRYLKRRKFRLLCVCLLMATILLVMAPAIGRDAPSSNDKMVSPGFQSASSREQASQINSLGGGSPAHCAIHPWMAGCSTTVRNSNATWQY